MVMPRFMVFLVIFSAQKCNPFGGVDDIGSQKQIIQKVFQSRAGNDNRLSRFRRLQLPA